MPNKHKTNGDQSEKWTWRTNHSKGMHRCCKCTAQTKSRNIVKKFKKWRWSTKVKPLFVKLKVNTEKYFKPQFHFQITYLFLLQSLSCTKNLDFQKFPQKYVARMILNFEKGWMICNIIEQIKLIVHPYNNNIIYSFHKFNNIPAFFLSHY